eukprot:m.320536 g.320536  ORF g.320536 m.320536 type:complete len:156 (+) comp16454_c0_seq9:2936-3403(+)
MSRRAKVIGETFTSVTAAFATTLILLQATGALKIPLEETVTILPRRRQRGTSTADVPSRYVPWSSQNSLGHNRCTQTHMSPDGLKYSDSLLPHAVNYSNPKGAVVQARRCVRWFTNQCLVDSIDKENQTLMFDSTIGCNQVGEGCVRFQDCGSRM